MPGVIAVNATDVFWSVEGTSTILACPISGCVGGPASITTYQGGASMVVDASNVYWFDQAMTPSYGLVMECSVAGCGGSPTALAARQNTPVAIAVDSTNVYWVDTDTSGWDYVMECAIGGCARTPTPLVQESGASILSSIVTDGTNVYWTDTGDGTFGDVRACAVSGCGGSPTMIAEGLDYPFDIVLNGSTLYWTQSHYVAGTGRDFAIASCPTTGCGGVPTTITSGNGAAVTPVPIATDGVDVYWPGVVGAGGYANSIMRVPVTGGTPSTFVTGQPLPSSIAVTSTCVYWTNQGTAANNYTDGSVMSMPK